MPEDDELLSWLDEQEARYESADREERRRIFEEVRRERLAYQRLIRDNRTARFRVGFQYGLLLIGVLIVAGLVTYFIRG